MTDTNGDQLGNLRETRTLVVGGNGFIGRHVVEHLLAAGGDVGILDMARGPQEFDHLDQVIGSVADTALFASAIVGCDNVVFLANSSLPGSANIDLASEVQAHVQVTVKAAEICRSIGVKRFVFASSGGTVYGYPSNIPLHEDMPTRPRTAYGVSKLTIEHYLRILGAQSDLTTVSLRISNPYGEGQRALRNQGFIAAALQHATENKVLTIWGDGTVERDFIHISDVARAFCAACAVDSPPEIVNIGSGEATSLTGVLSKLEKALGGKIQVEFEPGRSIDVARNVLMITRARETLGWKPGVSMDEGMTRTAMWWQSLSS